MTTRDDVTQDQIHAYVDGCLPPEELGRVEAWLADHPEDAARVHACRLQNTRLHETYDAVLDEDIPDSMMALFAEKKIAPSPKQIPWKQLAASLTLIFLGGVSGWLLNDQQNRGGQGQEVAFVDQAIGAHRVFVSEVRHPVEVPASQEAHLVAWLSKRIGTRINAPDLNNTGYQLVGGRLLADHAKPAAQFMYENNNGKRLTLYVRASGGDGDTAFRFVSENGASAFYWIDNNFAYALVAPLDRPELTPIVNQVYRDLTAR